MHALDHQGHGQSEGDRCYFERFAHLAEDVVQLVTAVKREALAGKPVYLLGHSMGALVALHVAAHPAMKGRLSGAWNATGQRTTGKQPPLARLLARLHPTSPLRSFLPGAARFTPPLQA